MKKIILKFLFALLICNSIQAQSNIFNGERVQVVGSFNGFVTSPYGTDYRTTSFRKLTVLPGSTPTDGRGQWTTTLNAQASGGDIMPINMNGGGGVGNTGFLLISGPIGNAFANKWAFATIGQGTVDGINFTRYNGGDDMGMNMSTAGYYTFVFNDCGYTDTDAKYYLGYTSAAPINVSRSLQVINGNNSASITATTSVAPSAQEKVYVRYTTGANFAGSGSSSVVQATGSGTSYTATIPVFSAGTMVTYYVFTSTKALAFFTTASEIDKSLAELRFDDNANTNYSYLLGAPVPVRLLHFSATPNAGSVSTKWIVTEEDDVDSYEILKSTNTSDFKTIGKIKAQNSLAPEVAYSLIDNNPTVGINYYQLLIKKFTGEKRYSDIASVNIKTNEQGIIVFTNASKNMLTLRLKNIALGNYNVNIFNALGQQVLSQKIERTNIYADENIFLKNKLDNGIYTISFSNSKEKITQRFNVN